MQTQPLTKYHLQKLSEVFQELLRIRSIVDTDEIIAVDIFLQSERELSHLQKQERPSLEEIKSLEKDLVRLKHYLLQFEEYSNLTKAFFQKIAEESGDAKLEASHAYLTVQKLARQIFEDFSEGKYFGIGLQKSVDSLKYFMRTFWRQFPDLSEKEPIGDSAIFQAAYQKHRKNEPESPFDLHHYLSQYMDTSRSSIAASRIKQIKEGYYRLYQRVLINSIKGVDYKLTKRVKLLETGLRKQNEQVINKALRLIQQLVQPTAIKSPINYLKTQKKLIKVTGISEPTSTMILTVNQQKKLRTIVADDQSFEFGDIELEFGDNDLICYNQDFLFLDNHKYHLHIHLERHYPFIGMYDPLTQKAFQESEAQLIVRCTTCKNYEYDFSVEENNNRCVFPKCEGRTFWNWEDMEYWME